MCSTLTGDKKPVQVIGGGPITIYTGVKDLHKNDEIEWKYQNIVIAKIKRGAITILNDFGDERSLNIFKQMRRRKGSSRRRIGKQLESFDVLVYICNIHRVVFQAGFRLSQD